MKATRRRSVNIGGDRRRREGPAPSRPPCRSPLPATHRRRITRVFTPRRSRRDTSSSVVRSVPSLDRSGRGIDQLRWQLLTRWDEPIKGERRPVLDEP